MGVVVGVGDADDDLGLLRQDGILRSHHLNEDFRRVGCYLNDGWTDLLGNSRLLALSSDGGGNRHRPCLLRGEESRLGFPVGVGENLGRSSADLSVHPPKGVRVAGGQDDGGIFHALTCWGANLNFNDRIVVITEAIPRREGLALIVLRDENLGLV